MILYLHGFRSSPDSHKSRIMAAELARRGLAQRWCCPQLPASPAAALRLALELVAQQGYGSAQTGSAGGDAANAGHPLVVVGSSLGGFYATWLAQQLACRAVLLNPVVHAARDLATQVGSHRTFHGDEPFEFLPTYVDELAQAEADIQALTQPERYFLLAATGDEVLDWREMQARFVDSPQRIIEGSDHGISDFERWLPIVLDFVLADARAVGAGQLQIVTAASGPDANACQIMLGGWDQLGLQASAVRLEVFVQEQHVPPEEEMDAMDVHCLHAVAYDASGAAVGTGRLLPDGHIGRMAVRQAGRGHGVGSQILTALVQAARQRGDTEVLLAAQLHARSFYARHGFVEEGETFMDAGIPHRLMRLRF